MEMSGEYTCKVSTLENEVSVTSRMVVETPPRRFAIHHRQSSYNSVNISCFVDHAFPRPSVALYHGQDRDRVRLKGVKEAVDRYPDGAWQVLMYIVLDDSSLQIENLFECEMSLPHTNFRLSRSTIYSPSKLQIYRCSENLYLEPYQFSFFFTVGKKCNFQAMIPKSKNCFQKSLYV